MDLPDAKQDIGLDTPIINERAIILCSRVNLHIPYRGKFLQGANFHGFCG